jgi:sugar phosphate isomerase/epimerase
MRSFAAKSSAPIRVGSWFASAPSVSSWFTFARGQNCSCFGAGGSYDARMKNSLALQLYSLRREFAADAEGTLRRVPSLGFDGVELAGLYDWSADKWQRLLAETGLKVVGAHDGLAALETEWAAKTQFQRALGNSRLIVSYLPNEMRSPAGYRDAARRMNTLGQRAKAEQFQLLYHNHAFEFEKLGDGTYGIDILLRETDPQFVRFQVDTYWVEKGGRNSRRHIERHAAHIGSIHAKELRKKDGADVAAGKGDIDFKFIVPLARQKGWPIVVEFEGEDAVAAVAESAKHLSQL